MTRLAKLRPVRGRRRPAADAPTPPRDARRAGGISAGILASLVLIVSVLAWASPQALAAPTKADEACKAWYEESPPDEQAREDVEAQNGQDGDKDGCTGMLAAPGSQGPVESAPKDPVGDPEAQEDHEEKMKEAADEPKDCSAWLENDSPQEREREEGQDVPRKDDLDGDGCIGDKPAPDSKKVPVMSAEECAARFAEDDPEEQAREREQDVAFGTDADGDGCVGEQPTDEATAPGGAPASTGPKNDPSDDPSGFTGMALGAFKAILDWLYTESVEKPSAQAAEAITEEAFQIPEVQSGGLMAKYDEFANLVKPGVIPIMVWIAYLMMFQGANYNSAYAAQSVLPKVFLFLAGVGFFPELITMFRDMTMALAKFLLADGALRDFMSGLYENNEGKESFSPGLMIIGQIVMFIMTIIVLLVSTIKNVLFGLLLVLGPLPMLLWTLPQLSDVASAWARALFACLILPLVFAAEISVGILMWKTPSLVLGANQDNQFTALIIGVVVLVVVALTPKMMLHWALSGHAPRGGFVATLTKSLILKKA